MAGRIVVLIPHEPRRFVETVEYVTSPGHAADGSRREGRPAPGGGPDALVTSKATFDFDDEGELRLQTVHPGADRASILADVPWDLRVAGDVTATEPPSQAVVDLIREFDPDGFWTGQDEREG